MDEIGGENDEIDRENFLQDGSLWPEYCNPSYVMPPDITVRVSSPTGEYVFPVSVQKFSGKKVYLGGYRNKLNGKIFHHSGSQTPTENRTESKDLSNLRTRETQTYEQRTCSVQPYRECGTQMQRIDLYLDDQHDVVVVSKPYFTAGRLLALKRVKTIEIQRCWRGYMARCRAIEMREKIQGYLGKAELKSMKLAETLKQDKTLEMQRRLHPHSKLDFAILYNELDVWRRAEIAQVKSTIPPGPDRTKAMYEVLQNETKGLQGIEKLKAAASKESRAEGTQRMLELMAQPQQWQLSTGDVASVQTTSTVKAKELLGLYRQLSSPSSSIDERLDILLQVKWTVKGYDGGQLVRDITELVDREADLLNRGRPSGSMDALRTRLANLFLQFVQDDKYNPRANELLGLPPVPTNEMTSKTSVYNRSRANM
eukprot:gene6450-13032_t